MGIFGETLLTVKKVFERGNFKEAHRLLDAHITEDNQFESEIYRIGIFMTEYRGALLRMRHLLENNKKIGTKERIEFLTYLKTADDSLKSAVYGARILVKKEKSIL